MKLTSEKLKKLIQEELNEMSQGHMSGEMSEDLKVLEEAYRMVDRLAGKYNNQTDPELYGLLGGAEGRLSSAIYKMKERLGLLEPGELDV